MRNQFARTIEALAADDDRVVLLSGDIGNRLFNRFKERFPDRFYNCGVAEQDKVFLALVLVPLVMDLGRLSGLDPRAMALLVGVCAQNSFLLPTHQVNALLMAPGGYRNGDYLKAGGAMTLLFLPIAVLGIYLVAM